MALRTYQAYFKAIDGAKQIYIRAGINFATTALTWYFSNGTTKGTGGAAKVESSVQNGATVYRRGNFNYNLGKESPYWSAENPLNPGYSKGYGLPEGNTSQIPDWIMGGKIKPGAEYRIQPAQGIGANTGGKPEVYIPNSQNNVFLDWFYMP